jgi:hypothetical protein
MAPNKQRLPPWVRFPSDSLILVVPLGHVIKYLTYTGTELPQTVGTMWVGRRQEAEAEAEVDKAVLRAVGLCV